MSGRYVLPTLCVGAVVVAATATTLPAAAEDRERHKGAVDKVLGELGDAVMERFAAEGPAAGPPLRLGELTAAPGTAGVLTRLRELYPQAEAAGETYRSTGTARLNKALAEARGALALSRAEAGRIAREQYQGTSQLSAYLELLLAREPQRALDQGHLIERVATGRLASMARLEAREKRSRELAAAARKALDRELVLAARKKQARDRAAARLRSAEGLLASLSAEQLTALATAQGAAAAPPGAVADGGPDEAVVADGGPDEAVVADEAGEAGGSGQAPDTDAR
ncbi:hypothetical protein [Streptomyces peucetius]|uniref:Uncharacterized protein n=1 Tax=Streptomyces peucetius TaxID=1950 RepID=A0ABY6IDV2_STRPE|nr:hypothetical protein [Streptomyces peucetius]UYQ64365.1 hypothetical protein OGH68_24790 [Streptomyces peucetius]